MKRFNIEYRAIKIRCPHHSEQQMNEIQQKYLDALPGLLESLLTKRPGEVCEEADRLYEIGQFFFILSLEEARPDISLLCFRLAAEHGSSRAQDCLGHFYENGFTINPDIKKAKEWYSKAAENGLVAAKKSLASILLKEQDSEDSQKKGFELLVTLIDEYDPDCFHELGLCYLQGCGTSQSQELADKYLRLAEVFGYGDDYEPTDLNGHTRILRRNGWQL